MAKYETVIHIDREDCLKKLAIIRSKKYICLATQLKDIGIPYNTLDRILTEGKGPNRPETVGKLLKYIEDNKALLD